MKALEIKSQILEDRKKQEAEANVVTFFEFSKSFIEGCNKERTRALYEWNFWMLLFFFCGIALTSIAQKKPVFAGF